MILLYTSELASFHLYIWLTDKTARSCILVTMVGDTFKVFLVTKTDDNQFTQTVTEQALERLSPGDVLIRVHYSSLNYKDALSATGNTGVTKKFPHVPGIDAAGVVVSSTTPQLQKDDPVIVTGFDLGMNTWGGFAEYIRVPANWVMPLPPGLTLKESMVLGTAGFTAALCVNALEQNNISPAAGEILVTGATGGVGTIAVSILAKLGYAVVAATGKSAHHDFLKSLGALSVLSREEVADHTGKPLLKERWAGVVDTVGGNILATAIKATKYDGCITACGLVGGAELPTTVYPFILRGVRLIGIDSAQSPLQKRLNLWGRLASDWKPNQLTQLASTINLMQLPEQIDRMLRGQSIGRVLVVLPETSSSEKRS
jgi:putative YhdH/YhfP family quinone oxidoreductase